MCLDMVHDGDVSERTYDEQVSDLEPLIADFRRLVSGELSDRSKVVDHLLDLRLAARDREATVVVIDDLLAELPGRTTVPNSWWLAALVSVERAR